jgi:hypothetical protein
MIIVDKALEKLKRERNPIRVAMVEDGAKRAYAEADVSDVRVCESLAGLEQSVRSKPHAVA